jgi:hypothetical protein
MNNENRIQPYSKNPFYWQYNGEPVLLLGGSVEDNLFQIPNLEEHLDLLKSVGGNYVRCTMSSRDDGNVWPFAKDPQTDLYDLNKPGEEHWQRFEHFLELAAERDIVAQFEMWDRFDFGREEWQNNPYNPKNNINYTVEESGLKEEINTHPNKNENAFFRSVVTLENNQVVLPYQHLQVEKMLSISFKYGNVLYCMNNETNEPPQWGQYWIQFIKDRAAEQGVLVYTTDMFDDWHKADENDESQSYSIVFDNPDIYTFVDISQVNSRNFHEIHWGKMQWLMNQVKKHPRPVNTVKTYGGAHTFWGSGRLEDGIERFWRNIIGGCASARFHRPRAGSGLNIIAQASINIFCRRRLRGSGFNEIQRHL